MNQRIFIEKKAAFDHLSKSFTEELHLINPALSVKVFILYDLFNISEEDFKKVSHTVFADPVMDILHTSEPDLSAYQKTVAVEFLPGQFDQRADSAEQAVKLITGKDDIKIRTAKLFAFPEISDKEFAEAKKLFINVVDAKEKDLSVLNYPQSAQPHPVPVIEGFIDFDDAQLEKFYQEWSFAFGLDDLKFIQDYFKKENRNPTETELKVLDTYWSDHCRHTTFMTELENISFEGDFQETLQAIYDRYLALRKELNREHKPISLMDFGTIAAKYFQKNGKLNDLVISDEINACTIEIEVDVEGKKEPWYLLFKNETHNHPTEIEPFGGASTCIGGAIRDPLSGRAFVYQAMRVTGAANPLENVEDTLEGKLPQRKITKEAANGYSSYGNQIGLATSQVSEIYHEGYKAKRMEVGFVVGAAPTDWVKREQPQAGDVVIVLGGKTGRDGVGGATGSSKTQKVGAIETMSAEVQKGDAVQERKIQRLFRKPEVTTLIKKSNDFGAGGVSVAIGEIADGVYIDLDVLPVKYDGLYGTELAISESQERMAVVVDATDAPKFLELARAENILAEIVGTVTDKNRLEIVWKGDKIVDLDREFLDTAGCRKKNNAKVSLNALKAKETKSLNKENFVQTLQSLNVASQKGLIEKFDSTVGQTTVLMPLGGKYQVTPALASVHTLPVRNKNTSTVSMASWGYDVDLSSENPLLGGAYAVVESVAKIVAAGGKREDVRLSFQEYFERLGTDENKWGIPLASLMGSLDAQLNFEIAAIGGKDSMSGTFHDLKVPPTLISFACCAGELKNVISPEFKAEGNHLYLFKHEPLENGMPNYEQLKSAYTQIHQLIEKGEIVSAQIVKNGGLASALALMAFGNKLGANVQFEGDWFSPMHGSLILESKTELNDFQKIGSVSAEKSLVLNHKTFDLDELFNAWFGTFESLFPTDFGKDLQNAEKSEITKEAAKNVNINSGAKPQVAMPIFSGTNCEYETEKVFREAGANPQPFIFNNLNDALLNDSVEHMVKTINESQILMLSGGFSSGDEPDGSAKFIVSVLKNPKIKQAVHDLIARDGLILGICNGFQALIKSGLVSFGEICDLPEDAPTLAHNKIGRHISQMVDVRVVSDRSPWLKGMKNQIYRIPISHGEGRFFAKPEVVQQLKDKDQIATQYVDLNGNVALDMPFNPNGSVDGIEGIMSQSGKIFGRMGHPERYRNGLLKNIPDAVFMDIFKNGVEYFK
ncbi:phosphoribosylformylglycinamidine synthase [Ornithobacterium rhinotracheale]|uniref:phosphoribosylformylglycinamidine synthase n=1 Tax=Ornithobacterium rhinotracheale TaxID=28251 RepID=UPI004036A470